MSGASPRLHVYRTRQAWEGSRASDELRRRRGSVLEELTVEEMRQLEPALSPNLYRGVFTPNANSITHPLHLSQRLFDLFRRSGGTFVKTNVTGFRNGPDGEPIRLSTDGESLPVDGLVMPPARSRNRSQNRPIASRGYRTRISPVAA